MALDNLGVKRKAFLDLQDAAKSHISLASDSLKIFASMLRSHGLGDMFRPSLYL